MTGDDIDKWIDATLEGDDIEAGPPLSTNELNRAHEDLATWRSPLDFRRTVARLHKRCLSSEIFRNPRQNFLLDAGTLAEFVRHKTVDCVRLTGPRENWPDGFVRLGQTIENVEITIAQTEGRRMGDEYRLGSPTLTHDPEENWVERANRILSALEKAITKKLEKRYGSGMWLVVYLNISAGGIRQAEIECAIAEIKQRHGQSFGGLFVIWKDKLL